MLLQEPWSRIDWGLQVGCQWQQNLSSFYSAFGWQYINGLTTYTVDTMSSPRCVKQLWNVENGVNLKYRGKNPLKNSIYFSLLLLVIVHRYIPAIYFQNFPLWKQRYLKEIRYFFSGSRTTYDVNCIFVVKFSPFLALSVSLLHRQYGWQHLSWKMNSKFQMYARYRVLQAGRHGWFVI